MACRKILLVGASGALGKEVLNALKADGHHVRVLSRSQDRLNTLPADEAVCGDALKPQDLQGICEGIEIVVSCLGASVAMKSPERRSYLQVDLPAHQHLLAEAKRAGVSRFVYVSLWIEAGYEANGYVQAHRQVEAAIKASGLSYSILRPTGLYSAMLEFLTMAQSGVGMLPGGGQGRSNPVHEAEVANKLLVYLESGPKEIGIGGPEVLSRREILDLAFDSVGKPRRYVKMSLRMLNLLATLIRPFNARMSDLMRFFAQVASTHLSAPKVGERTLKDYFAVQVSLAQTSAAD